LHCDVTLTSHRTVSTCFSIRCPGGEPEHLQKETVVSLHNLYAHYLQVLCQEQIYSYAPHTQPHVPDSPLPPQVLKVRIKSFELHGILFSSVRFNKNSKQNNYAAQCSFFSEPSKCVFLMPAKESKHLWMVFRTETISQDY